MKSPFPPFRLSPYRWQIKPICYEPRRFPADFLISTSYCCCVLRSEWPKKIPNCYCAWKIESLSVIPPPCRSSFWWIASGYEHREQHPINHFLLPFPFSALFAVAWKMKKILRFVSCRGVINRRSVGYYLRLLLLVEKSRLSFLGGFYSPERVEGERNSFFQFLALFSKQPLLFLLPFSSGFCVVSSGQ